MRGSSESVMRNGNASDQQLTLSLNISEDETVTGAREEHTPVSDQSLMERVVERDNLFAALHQVRRNKGGPGIDGMTVEQLGSHLKAHWPQLCTQLLTGKYQPQPVKRVLIPKPGGGARQLGIPTVVDRFIQQAILQILQLEWDRTFSHFSFGFRPHRSARHAVAWAQHFQKEGKRWVVDMDLEKFFDRVNHDVLMHRVKQRVKDNSMLQLINRFLKSGVCIGATFSATTMGTPQGGPLSPLLSNVLLDDLDKELERRGHRFARYADDCNIYVGSERAGQRVLASIKCFLEKRLKLSVNEHKSAVDRPWSRTFLGFTFTRSRDHRRKVSEKSITKLKAKIRMLTQRTRGRSMTWIIADLKDALLGWKAYFGFAEVDSALREIDKWIRRRLRCYLWKQWGGRGYRELRSRGVSRQLAWNTAKSAHGPWRLSRSPALSYALPAKYFADLGLPSLAKR